jgi:hypothetical protein
VVPRLRQEPITDKQARFSRVIGGESDPTCVQILAEGASTSLKLVNKDGRQLLTKP